MVDHIVPPTVRNQNCSGINEIDSPCVGVAMIKDGEWHVIHMPSLIIWVAVSGC